MPELAIFPTRNPAGEALAKDVKSRAETHGFKVKVFHDSTPGEFLQVCRTYQVVVLDATPDRKGEHNYHFAAPYTIFDHLLVVSRKYLPMNFTGTRERISDPRTGKEITGAPIYPFEQTNQEILRWVEVQLDDWLMHDGHYVPEGRDIFISYRNTKNPVTQVDAADEVEALAAALRQQGRTVRYFPPKSLSSELMTEMRRWQLLSWIDRFIGETKELWIYETDDYYNSWWTLAELTTWMYRKQSGTPGLPKLRIYNSRTKTLSDPPPNFLPTLTGQQRNRIARWYVHADAKEMSPESFIAGFFYSHLPLIGQLKYFQDPVYKPEFWTDPIFDCPRCRVLGQKRNQFDVEAFLNNKGPNFFRIPHENMQELLAEGELTCPRCTKRYKLRSKDPHYLWMPVINNQATGEYWLRLFGFEPREPGESHLVPLPSYDI